MSNEIAFNEATGVFACVGLTGDDLQLVEDLRRAAQDFASTVGNAEVFYLRFPGLHLLMLNQKATSSTALPRAAHHVAPSTHLVLKVGHIPDPPNPDRESPTDWAGRDGRYCWLRWAPRTGTVDATSDCFGVRAIFYAVVKGQLVLSTEPAILYHASCIPREVDPVGSVDMLQKGCCYGDRTLLKAVRYLPPASILRFQAGRVHVQRLRWLPVGIPPPAVASLDDFADGLYERLRASTERWATTQSAWRVFLSGGLDSRTCLGLLRDAGRLRGAINWGQRRVGDSLVAKKIAKALDVDFNYLVLGHDHLQKHHENLISLAGGLTNAHITYLIAALRKAEVDGGGIATGYFGDALTGHIRFEVPGGDPMPSLDDSVEHFHAALGRFFHAHELQNLLRLPDWKAGINACRDDIKKTMLATGSGYHYQRWIAAYLWCRHLRYTVFLPRLVGNFAPTFSPFEDLAVFRFALALPPEALRGQAAYRHMLSRHFPDLQRFSQDSGPRRAPDDWASPFARIYRRFVAYLPPRLGNRLDYWSDPGWSIDPNGDLRIGSADYLRDLVKNHATWDWAFDRTQVTRLIEDHLADRQKAGFQIQALVTVIEGIKTALDPKRACDPKAH